MSSISYWPLACCGMGGKIMTHTSSKKTPLTGQEAEIQQYGTVINRPLSLDHKARLASVDSLNQILADTMTLRDLYKKHHWQVSGPTFYQLHLLFDKHYGEQAELVDTLAERIQTLGGVAIAMAHDVAETTRVARVPKGREDATIQLFRLLQAHELIIDETRRAAHTAAADGDDGTNDLLVSDVLRRNELQVWFISEQLAGAGLTDKDEEAANSSVKAHA
jgi:starvation-inducible DNA-binding protein